VEDHLLALLLACLIIDVVHLVADGVLGTGADLTPTWAWCLVVWSLRRPVGCLRHHWERVFLFSDRQVQFENGYLSRALVLLDFNFTIADGFSWHAFLRGLIRDLRLHLLLALGVLAAMPGCNSCLRMSVRDYSAKGDNDRFFISRRTLNLSGGRCSCFDLISNDKLSVLLLLTIDE
jgi:hypothetical protein